MCIFAPQFANQITSYSMSTTIVLKKGLDIPISGESELRVSKTIAPGIVAEVDALEMTLVVSNLYKNAAEACREGKDARIEVRLFRTQDGIFLTFADNGKVLEAKDIEDLAVPLKTSKESGLGLGLSIVRRIVESHGGDVKFEALNPKGLCVTIHLPEIEGQSEYGKHEAAGIDSHRG